jgi:alpha-glucoside transport system substrate-binding protein
MEERRLGWRRAAGVLAATALVVAACQGGSSPAATTVSVIGTWGGDEEQSFLAMVAPFEADTGIDVQFTGTRDINAILTTGVASGVLPDLAGLPGPGQMAEWKAALKPLDDVLDIETYKAETAPALVELGTLDGQVYGVFIKATVKGLMWFSPSVSTQFATPPATWDDLEAALAQNPGGADSDWCVGLESGAASGWPATDWIEDIVLRQSGPDVYNQWHRGEIAWTSPEIRGAFEIFAGVLENSYGGANAILTTYFENGGDPLFASPPGCQLHHQGSFITAQGAFKDKVAGTDYDFFPFPDINPSFTGAVEGGGDLFGMFHDTDAAKQLMAYLVTAEAQDIWVQRGGALSPNKNAQSYPDDIAQRSADLLVNASVLAFDASDLMPNAMNTAFWQATLDLAQDPSNIDSILEQLDTIQADAYAS